MKNIFTAPPGMILCATDFSFIELCMFAESCVQRFGFSVMSDVINAGIDPHRWFAGVMNKLIDSDLSRKDDKEWVAQLNKFLEENVDKKTRNKAKMAKTKLALQGVTPVEEESELLEGRNCA